MEKDPLTEKIIGCAIEVHKALGPGLLESAYEKCFCYELVQSGLFIERQKPIPLVYKEVNLDCCFKLDILVNNSVIIELKSVEKLLPIHEAQLISYLKLANIRTGLLINFNTNLLVDGIKRRVV